MTESENDENLIKLNKSQLIDIIRRERNDRNSTINQIESLFNKRFSQLEADLAARIEFFEKENQTLKSEIEALKIVHNDSLDKIRTDLSQLKNKYEVQASAQQKNTHLDDKIGNPTIEIISELTLREKKKNNVIIFGLNEVEDIQENTQEDTVDHLHEQINKVLETLKIPYKDVIHYKKIGRKSTEKKRPLILTFRTKEDKEKIFKNAVYLKNSNFKQISIRNDLTKMEITESKNKKKKKENESEINETSVTNSESKI